MTRPCEVCTGLVLAGMPAAPAVDMRRVVLGGRIVALCGRHAAAVVDDGIDDLSTLRDRFLEREGQRSAVDRRSPLDRRVFPPRPEGRRRTQGRRSSDP